jgi:hypothetical protein
MFDNMFDTSINTLISSETKKTKIFVKNFKSFLNWLTSNGIPSD